MLNEVGLKACPFCGNDGSGRIEDALHVIHEEPSDWRSRDTWTVQCDDCTATMGYSDSPDEAIEAWNRRASVQGEQKPVAWRYRWKLDGEWTNWRVSDHSQKSQHLKDLEEFPLYTHPVAPDGVEARTIDEWHEDDGSVCWWALDENGQWLGEPAYIGSPLDLGRAYSLSIGEHEFVATLGGWPGYHTHWTPHPALPAPPAGALKGGA